MTGRSGKLQWTLLPPRRCSPCKSWRRGPPMPMTRRPPPKHPICRSSATSDLNGAGKGGEGLALRQYPDGRRILFLAHESAPMCVSIIDVTNPEDPKVVTQIPVDGPDLAAIRLGLSGTTLAVAHQTDKPWTTRRRA